MRKLKEMEEKATKSRTKTNKPYNTGITLIALVVTIVVLLILAGITINAILSEGGILNTAKNAQNVQQEATVREKVQVMLADAKLKGKTENKSLSDYLTEENYTIKEETDESITITEDGYEITIDKETYQIEGITTGEGDTNPPEEKPQVADLINQDASQTNTYAQDKYGNSIVILAGFKVLANGTQGVVYDYDKNEEGTSTNVPVVQDGIVIQHEEDLNEFVWVPVGEIKNNAEGTNTTEIKLGRYSDFTMDTTTTPPTPPSPKQEANKDTYDTVTADDLISSSYFENSTGTYNGTQYKATGNFETLGSWIANTIDNGGYYIARYEASYGANGEADSKPSVGTPLNNKDANRTVAKTEGQLWNWITQSDASTASKFMYQESEGLGYYSELVNSYAWDTAIIFIQTYEDVDYASQQSLYKDTTAPFQPANTGERGSTASIGANTTDKVCNIYDIASNVREWTTETYKHSNNPCICKGGYFVSASTTSSYYNSTADNSSFFIGFRPLLNCSSET